MTTLDQQAETLKQQLKQIEQNKVAEQERAYQENLTALANSEDAAIAYRNQALKTTSDDDRAMLYRLAEDADRETDRLRVELNLVSQSDLESANFDRINNENLSLERKINGLFFKAVSLLGGFILSDFFSGQVPEGFFSYLLKLIGLILWPVSVAFGGIWVTCKALLVFISTSYGLVGIRNDFNKLNPTARLAILTALLAAILHLLSTIVPHAN